MTSLMISLKQHVGAPCEPIVSVGDEVKRGQLIAKPQGLGANIHASVNGKVVAITDQGVQIEQIGDFTTDFMKIPETATKLEAIEAAGIVGAGGAGFPTHVKLSTKIPGGYILANAAECEPLLSHNVEQMETHPETVIDGLIHCLDITEAKAAYIAIKPKNKKAMIALSKAAKKDDRIQLKYLSDMYPAGDERVIVREILGITLEPGELPLKANAVVVNVETLKHISEAIDLRKPVIDKDLTVGGRVVDELKVFMNQPIGLPLKHFIDEAGGYIHPHGEIVVGGPFTGQSGSEETPVTKTTGGALVAMPYPNDKRKVGILICECGAGRERLHEIAEGMGAEVVSEQMCKRMVEVNGRYRCSLPGICPGQAEKVLAMKKDGAETVLAGTCQD